MASGMSRSAAPLRRPQMSDQGAASTVKSGVNELLRRAGFDSPDLSLVHYKGSGIGPGNHWLAVRLDNDNNAPIPW